MTATAPVLRPRARRIYIMMLFALLGPAVGAFAMLAVLMSFAAFDGGDLTTWLQSTPLALVLGYIYGSGPAALAGVAYALAPRGLQRPVLSPLMGATIIAVFFAALGPLPLFTLADPRRDLEMYGLLIFSGAAAAFVCAAIARALTWDAHGVGSPTPAHERLTSFSGSSPAGLG